MLTHALQHEKHGITKNSFPPIIIVLEDLERCPVDVINDLILILRLVNAVNFTTALKQI